MIWDSKSGSCYECWIFAVCNGSKKRICDMHILKDAWLKELSWNCNHTEIGVSLFTVKASYWKWNSEQTYEGKKVYFPLFHCNLALIMLLRAWTPLYTWELLLHSIVRVNEEWFSNKSDSKALSLDILYWYPSIIESQWCTLSVALTIIKLVNYFSQAQFRWRASAVPN